MERSDRPPKWIKPQLTRLVDEAPAGAGWLHEIKYEHGGSTGRIVTDAQSRRSISEVRPPPATPGCISVFVSNPSTEPSRNTRLAWSFLILLPVGTLIELRSAGFYMSKRISVQDD